MDHVNCKKLGQYTIGLVKGLRDQRKRDDCVRSGVGIGLRLCQALYSEQKR